MDSEQESVDSEQGWVARKTEKKYSNRLNVSPIFQIKKTFYLKKKLVLTVAE